MKKTSPKVKKAKPIRHDEVFDNPLTIPDSIREDLAKRGLTGRWVSYMDMKKFDGFNPKGWQVYKRSGATSSEQFVEGSNPDGYVRRGDLVLAVKSNEQARKHREYLNQKAERQSQEHMRKSVEELRSLSKEVGASIVEGYDEE